MAKRKRWLIAVILVILVGLWFFRPMAVLDEDTEYFHIKSVAYTAPDKNGQLQWVSVTDRIEEAWLIEQLSQLRMQRSPGAVPYSYYLEDVMWEVRVVADVSQRHLSIMLCEESYVDCWQEIFGEYRLINPEPFLAALMELK